MLFPVTTSVQSSSVRAAYSNTAMSHRKAYGSRFTWEKPHTCIHTVQCLIWQCGWTSRQCFVFFDNSNVNKSGGYLEMESFSFQSLSSCQTGQRHHSKWKMFIFHWNSWDGFELVSSLETSLPRFPFHEILLSLLGKWLSPSPSTLNKAAQASALHSVSFKLRLYRSHTVMTNFHMTSTKKCQRRNDKEASVSWLFCINMIFSLSLCKVLQISVTAWNDIYSLYLSVHPLVGFGYSQHIKALI